MPNTTIEYKLTWSLKYCIQKYQRSNINQTMNEDNYKIGADFHLQQHVKFFTKHKMSKCKVDIAYGQNIDWCLLARGICFSKFYNIEIEGTYK